MSGCPIANRQPFLGSNALIGAARALFRTAAIALIALFIGYQTPGASARQQLSREELQADITEAYDFLKRYHPNLTAHKTRKELDELYNRIIDSVRQESSTEQALITLSELVGAVCDAHTTLSIRSSVNTVRSSGWPWYRLPLFVQSRKLYLEASGGETKEEVISINDVMGADIASALAGRNSGDGCLDDSTLFVAERMPLNAYVVGEMIGYSGPYAVKSRPSDSGNARVYAVKAVNHYTTLSHRARFKQAQYNQMKISLFVEDFERQIVGADADRARLDYRFSESRNMAYLRVGSFESRRTAEKGIEIVMRDIIDKKPDALVIDLVDNPGGRIITAQFLMAFLLPRAHRLVSKTYVRNSSNKRTTNFRFFDEEAKNVSRSDVKFFRRLKSKNGVRTANIRKRSFGKPDYKGPIYVLLSPQSHSAALHVAVNLKRLRNAKIVGGVTATDTVTSCIRAYGKFTLKNSRIQLFVPERCYSHQQNRFNDEYTLVPDIEISLLDGPSGELNALIFEAALDDFDASRAN